MNKLDQFKAFELGKAQMNDLVGGSSAKEYCDRLYNIASNKKLSTEEKAGLNAGWIAGDCDQFDYNGFSVEA